MNKILLIIKREYLSRVRKKSFIIMTILGPVLMAGLILAPILLMDSSDEEKKEIWVCDENNLFEPQFEKSQYISVFLLIGSHMTPNNFTHNCWIS